MGLVTFKWQMHGLAEAMRAVDNINKFVESDKGRETIAVAGLRGAAVLFDRNFATEGGEVGGWADLADRTVAEREQLGFGGEHPILVRYGDLRQLTATSLMAASGAGTFSKTDAQGKSINVSLVTRGGAVNVVASGEKSINQVPTRTGNPARPYWFVNSAVKDAIRKMAVKELADQIVRVI